MQQGVRFVCAPRRGGSEAGGTGPARGATAARDLDGTLCCIRKHTVRLCSHLSGAAALQLVVQRFAPLLQLAGCVPYDVLYPASCSRSGFGSLVTSTMLYLGKSTHQHGFLKPCCWQLDMPERSTLADDSIASHSESSLGSQMTLAAASKQHAALHTHHADASAGQSDRPRAASLAFWFLQVINTA